MVDNKKEVGKKSKKESTTGGSKSTTTGGSKSTPLVESSRPTLQAIIFADEFRPHFVPFLIHDNTTPWVSDDGE